MSDTHEHHEDHGHSVAAWTGVGVILVGTAIMSFAVLDPNLVLFIVGTVISILGAVAAKVLSMAGYGGKQVLTEGGDAPESDKPELGIN